MGIGEDPLPVDPWPEAEVPTGEMGGVISTPPAVRLLAAYRVGESERSIEIRWETDFPTRETLEQLVRVLGADARPDEDVTVTADVADESHLVGSNRPDDHALIPDDWVA